MFRKFSLTLVALTLPTLTIAAPRAAIVVDADTREILYSENIDEQLHPAQLTQLMTLLLAFEEIEEGQASLDDRIRISSRAAEQPRPSLGLKGGQRIRLRYLLTASATGKRFDAATAIAEGVAENEKQFVDRMNARATELCMLNSNFENPRGHRNSLAGHFSTAHDLAILGTQIFQTHPEIFALTIRKHINTGDFDMLGTHARRAREIGNTNGLMTGYRQHAGYVAIASIQHADRNLIAVTLGERNVTALPSRIKQIVGDALVHPARTFGVLDHCAIS